MNKNKGFTLVELLAVIAILAILVLIALPNIMGMFNQAKENSFKTELKVIYKIAGQTWIKDSMLDTKEITYSRCDNCLGVELDLSGRTEIKYCIKLDKAGKVKEYYASDGTFSYSYTGGDLKVEEIKTVDRVNSNEVLTCDGVIEPLPSGDPTQGVYFIANTGSYYNTLSEAFNAVANNQTIKVLQNKTETVSSALASDKTGIKLDINGKTLTMTNCFIQNDGVLDIYNSSSVDGNITGGGNYLINNNGSLSLNSTQNSNKITIEKTANNNSDGSILNAASKSLMVNNNVYIKVSAGESSGINNFGSLTVVGGSVAGTKDGVNNRAGGTANISGSSTYINSTGDSSAAIHNSGILMVTDGTILGNLYGLVNYASGETTISGSNTKVKPSHSRGNGVSNIGTLTIIDGDVSAHYIGVNNSGTATILGGKITVSGIEEIGINNRGLLTLGSNDGVVNINSPVISVPGTQDNYGIYSTGTLNYYDGVVKVKYQNGNAIFSTTLNKPNGYIFYNEIVNQSKNVYLVAE